VKRGNKSEKHGKQTMDMAKHDRNRENERTKNRKRIYAARQRSMESRCYLVVRMMSGGGGGERGRIAEEILPRRVHVLASHHFCISRFLRSRPSEQHVARIAPSASMDSWSSPLCRNPDKASVEETMSSVLGSNPQNTSNLYMKLGSLIPDSIHSEAQDHEIPDSIHSQAQDQEIPDSSRFIQIQIHSEAQDHKIPDSSRFIQIQIHSEAHDHMIPDSSRFKSIQKPLIT
jgi:hypothetical protein